MLNAARRITRARTGWLSLVLCALWLLGVPAQAQTSAPDVGLVTKLSGEATYWNQDDQKEPARLQTFMKIRRGDNFKLPQGAEVQILYFASGRQETWKGPATFKAGEAESQAAAGQQLTAHPEVTVLPGKATKRMAGSALPLPRAGLRYSGVIQTMGAGKEPSPAPAKVQMPPGEVSPKRLQEAEKTYRDLRKKAPADDLTPELYFLSVLADHQQYSRMEKILDAMLAKKAGDATLKELQAWARSQAVRTSQPEK